MSARTLAGVLLLVCVASCDGEGVTQRTDGVRPADQSFVATPLVELTDDQKDAAEVIIGESGFVDGDFVVLSWEPGYEMDGSIAGLLAVVRLEPPVSGTVLWPAVRVGVDDGGERVPVGYDITYELTDLEFVTFSIDLTAGAVRSLGPGDMGSTPFPPVDGSVVVLGTGPERRLDGKDEPIPPSPTGL